MIQIYVISPEICNLPKFLYVNFVCSSFTDLVILVVVGQFSVMTRTIHTLELNAGIHAKVRVLQPALASSTCLPLRFRGLL